MMDDSLGKFGKVEWGKLVISAPAKSMLGEIKKPGSGLPRCK